MDASQILQLLPNAYQESERRAQRPTVLTALLGVMNDLHAPIEQFLLRYSETFSVLTCAEPQYPVLGAWLAEFFPGSTEASCERELLTQLGRIQAERGTPASLLRVLRLATACSAITITESESPSFHLIVSGPKYLEQDELLIRALLDEHTPAHVTHELTFV